MGGFLNCHKIWWFHRIEGGERKINARFFDLDHITQKLAFICRSVYGFIVLRTMESFAIEVYDQFNTGAGGAPFCVMFTGWGTGTAPSGSCQNVRDTANLCVIWTPVCVENYWCAVVRYLTQMCVIWLFWNLFSKISTFEKNFCKILKKSYTSTKLQKIVA